MSKHLLPLCLLILTACGNPAAPPVEPKCDANTCSGCCQYDNDHGGYKCVTKTTDSACGVRGESCHSCGTGEGCVSGACEYVEDALPAGAKQVFQTSATYTGNLGGIAGADMKCAAAASAAGLTGTWVAWISDLDALGANPRPTVHAIDRIKGNGPWYLTCRNSQKKLIKAFTNRDALAGAPSEVICTEKGDYPGAGVPKTVWTGTAAGGKAKTGRSFEDAPNCKGWTAESTEQGRVGNAFDQPTEWTDFLADGCYSKNHLYCFQL